MTKWTATSVKGGKSYAYSPRIFQYNYANDFLMDGRCRFYLYYKNHIRDWAEPLEVGADDIRKGINAAKERFVGYNLDADAYLHALLTDDYNIEGCTVAVFGCTTPWYATLALAYGAKGVVIVTEREVNIDDDRIVVAKPEELKQGFADYAISICEFQDEGFGKHDGETNPDRDIELMQVAKGTLKVGGKLLLSVPCGADMVVWNKARIYGRHRLKKLMDGWTILGSVGLDEQKAKRWTIEDNYTPLFILEKQ